MTELKPCPFCGETDAFTMTDCRELEECENFDRCVEDMMYWRMEQEGK